MEETLGFSEPLSLSLKTYIHTEPPIPESGSELVYIYVKKEFARLISSGKHSELMKHTWMIDYPADFHTYGYDETPYDKLVEFTNEILESDCGENIKTIIIREHHHSYAIMIQEDTCFFIDSFSARGSPPRLVYHIAEKIGSGAIFCLGERMQYDDMSCHLYSIYNPMEIKRFCSGYSMTLREFLEGQRELGYSEISTEDSKIDDSQKSPEFDTTLEYSEPEVYGSQLPIVEIQIPLCLEHLAQDAFVIDNPNERIEEIERKPGQTYGDRRRKYLADTPDGSISNLAIRAKLYKLLSEELRSSPPIKERMERVEREFPRFVGRERRKREVADVAGRE